MVIFSFGYMPIPLLATYVLHPFTFNSASITCFCAYIQRGKPGCHALYAYPCVYINSSENHDRHAFLFSTKQGFRDVGNHSNTRSQHLTFSFTCSSHSVPHQLYTHSHVRKTQLILMFHYGL